MEKSFCKLVTNIIYEGYSEWWSIEKIAAESIEMEYDKFMDKNRFPEGARKIICEHMKTFIPHVYRILREEMGTMLLSEMIEEKRCYKCAVAGDEPYILKILERNKRLNVRAIKRFDRMIENIKQNKLINDNGKSKLNKIIKV